MSIYWQIDHNVLSFLFITLRTRGEVLYQHHHHHQCHHHHEYEMADQTRLPTWAAGLQRSQFWPGLRVHNNVASRIRNNQICFLK